MLQSGTSIIIEEQGMRDGLQSLSKIATTEQKLDWIRLLIDAGLKRIQIGSFVNSTLVPTMADTDLLFETLQPLSDTVILSSLVLNPKGVERAVSAGAKHLSISLSASETHSLKNTNKGISASKDAVKEMVKTALDVGITVRGGIQCAFGCRYEGRIDEDSILDLADFMLDQGTHELVLADSTGMGSPDQIQDIMTKVVAKAGLRPTGLHLHNTENKGYANLYAGLMAGVKIFDTAFGGLGGCPFIKNATGNIATEDVVHMCRQLGIETNIDISKVTLVSDQVAEWLGDQLPGYMYRLIKDKDIKFT